MKKPSTDKQAFFAPLDLAVRKSEKVKPQKRKQRKDVVGIFNERC